MIRERPINPSDSAAVKSPPIPEASFAGLCSLKSTKIVPIVVARITEVIVSIVPIITITMVIMNEPVSLMLLV